MDQLGLRNKIKQVVLALIVNDSLKHKTSFKKCP